MGGYKPQLARHLGGVAGMSPTKVIREDSTLGTLKGEAGGETNRSAR